MTIRKINLIKMLFFISLNGSIALKTQACADPDDTLNQDLYPSGKALTVSQGTLNVRGHAINLESNETLSDTDTDTDPVEDDTTEIDNRGPRHKHMKVLSELEDGIVPDTDAESGVESNPDAFEGF
jgi:hypothetical protein